MYNEQAELDAKELVLIDATTGTVLGVDNLHVVWTQKSPEVQSEFEDLIDHGFDDEDVAEFAFKHGTPVALSDLEEYLTTTQKEDS